ncbi:purine-nucleoside phosphorylase [Clostridium sp. Cult3]|uniref:purine-nucleoside phosphorylase n=1 Tax=Clostridium sp. Cult3 TaxID=2079004 RepID=UPI001F027205|nr:purine-nucleoside phosphorylase [Clostridium sp. Cult3]MCF6460159.1 purine-nucleoside phosphorylase [Clostridium sp. Cult3]
MLLEKVNESIKYIKSKTGLEPTIGVILGTGLGEFVDMIENQVIIPYEEIPNFPASTAPGHEGRLIIGECMNKAVLCMQGRFHYYEGYSMEEVTYPIRVMQKLGLENLIITNAAGGLNSKLRPGDLMIIDDHINFMGNNPLIGQNQDAFGPRFVDMSKSYDPELIKIAYKAAENVGISLRQGVYVGYTGPSFETAAEIKLFNSFGGSAVGMSTVPEVIVANHGGLKVLAISCITNLGTGILDNPLSVEEVFETATNAGVKFRKLLENIIDLI